MGVNVLFFISATLAQLFNGYALSVLWGWFIVPQFNVAGLSFPMALGLNLIMGYFLLKPKDINEPTDKYKMAVFVWVKPLLALAFGWLYQLFM